MTPTKTSLEVDALKEHALQRELDALPTYILEVLLGNAWACQSAAFHLLVERGVMVPLSPDREPDSDTNSAGVRSNLVQIYTRRPDIEYLAPP